MCKDHGDLLTVLRSELEFLEKGGYRTTASAHWRPQFIFQDSPACLNFDPTQPPRSCSECTLMQLVPADSAERKVPCRFIPLNDGGETIDSFYRYGTAEELETAFGEWLRSTIKRLETGKRCNGCGGCARGSAENEISAKNGGKEVAMIAECANPACRVAFDYHNGRYFRFHKIQHAGEQRPNTHCVQHFWLCQTCSTEYTLEHHADRGVLLLSHSLLANQTETCRFVAAA